MKTKYSPIALLILGLLFGCNSPSDQKEEGTELVALPASFNIRFSSTPPADLPSANATPQELVEFAWEEFLALNWKSSYAIDSKRDHPDTNWSYEDSSSAYPDLVVWETFGHRTELRPYSDKMEPFDNAPHYSFGTPLAPYPGTNASFKLFNVLDENNEIGSCDLYAFADTEGKDRMVLYQAKVNRDEYEYIYNQYPTKAKLLAATTYTYGNIKNHQAYYPGVSSSCDVPTGFKGVSLPCGNLQTKTTGAMEIKTAWRELTPKDDPSKFFTREVVVFKAENGKDYYVNETYALIGIHIIHKTTNYDDFVFATWEHVGVENDNMAFELIGDSTDTSLHVDFPRLHPIDPITDASTSYVHQQLKKMNPKSIWQNYRLTGVQGQPSDNTQSFNFYLANYVIESDSALANFHGSGFANPHDMKPNILYKNSLISQGGCQGCHGVAQLTLGTDLSFLLDTIGKPVYAPDISVDPLKLSRFVQATTLLP